jgi:hydroxyacyl-ACP dehydratase HTD2-like protein with hotdog domain
MWAAGRVRFPQQSGPLLDGKRAVCIEGIRDVKVKGLSGEEKIYVGIERRVATVEEQETEEQLRSRIWQPNEEDFGDAEVIERRDLVFMREKTPEQLQNDKASFSKSSRIVRRTQN